MRSFILTVIITILSYSCNTEVKNENSDSNLDSIPQEKEYLSAYKIIYNNNQCLDWNVETLPIIELESDTILTNEKIKGNLFFSSNYLRKLAECNNLDYKIAFDIFKSNRTIDTSISKTNGDTIFFTMPYDSLKIVKSTKQIDEYLIQGKLRASFFKLNEVLGYDTMMPINKKIFVIKKGDKK